METKNYVSKSHEMLFIEPDKYSDKMEEKYFELLEKRAEKELEKLIKNNYFEETL
jgi:hypothetical protein